MASIRTAKDALDWFEERVRTATGTRQALFRAENSQRGATVIGKMFFFKYDPKTKEKLPVYDVYPLIFPIEMYEDGFLGLNIHYLDIPNRIAFLNQLRKYATATNLTEKSRLRISYDLISSTAKLVSRSRPCIKSYLYPHVRSKFIEIPATEWDRAANLPVELFVYKK